MKEFSSLDAFSKHLKDKVINQHSKRQTKALNFIGQYLEDKSKETIGHLQTGAGDFPGWKELAESTKIDKEKKGYVFNSDYNPLYREGNLKRSISHVVYSTPKEARVYIGSHLDIALYQELGTNKIPARSFLGLTLFKEKYQIQFVLGLFLHNWIINTHATLRTKD